MSFNFMAAVSIHSDFGTQENEVCHCFYIFPIYLPRSYWTWCHNLSFLNVKFKPAFSLSAFTFIKRLFGSSSVSAIRVVSSACLRLLIFLLAILIPVCDSSSLAFHMMYCAFKLNKQGYNIQPCLVLSQFWTIHLFVRSNQCFLICIQVSQKAGKVVWYSHLFKNFP